MKRLPVVLETHEVEALLDAANTSCPTGFRNRALLTVVWRCGLRVSEVCDLRTTQIRWTDCILEIRNGKGGRDRNIPLDAKALDWLTRWRPHRADSPFFFSSLSGQRLSPRYIQQLIKRLAVRALGPERGAVVTPHVLRHTYATELLDEGFTLREVQDLLGHASVATTQIYTHVRPKALAEKIRQRGAQ